MQQLREELMKNKAKSNQAEQTKSEQNPAETMAQTATKTIEQAVSTSSKFQEEVATPVGQKVMEEMIVLLEQNSRNSAELMKKALEAAQTPSLTESQSRWMDFWTSSIGVFQSNLETLTHISTRMMDSWMEGMRKSGVWMPQKA